jgi:hypothetical protein
MAALSPLRPGLSGARLRLVADPTAHVSDSAHVFVQARFDVPDRVVAKDLGQLIADVLEIVRFADALDVATARRIRPELRDQNISGALATFPTASDDELSRMVRRGHRAEPNETRVVSLRYSAASLHLLLQSVPAVEGTAYAAWALAFAQDLPGRIGEAWPPARDAVAGRPRDDALNRIDAVRAGTYEAWNELQIVLYRLVKEHLERAAPAYLSRALEPGNQLPRLAGVESLVDAGISDQTIESYLRLARSISGVEVVDEPEPRR